MKPRTRAYIAQKLHRNAQKKKPIFYKLRFFHLFSFGCGSLQTENMNLFHSIREQINGEENNKITKQKKIMKMLNENLP